MISIDILSLKIGILKVLDEATQEKGRKVLMRIFTSEKIGHNRGPTEQTY